MDITFQWQITLVLNKEKKNGFIDNQFPHAILGPQSIKEASIILHPYKLFDFYKLAISAGVRTMG